MSDDANPTKKARAPAVKSATGSPAKPAVRAKKPVKSTAGPRATAKKAADVVAAEPVPEQAVVIEAVDSSPAASLAEPPSDTVAPARKRQSLFEAADDMRSSARRVINTAREAAEQARFVAREAAKEVASMASETAKSAAEMANEGARTALQRASRSAQMVAQLAEDGAKMTAQLANDTAKAAGQMAREVAMQMAQAYLRKSTITLPLPESLINKQMRNLAARHASVDYLAVYCGDDRVTVAIDGHHNRLIYTVEMKFDVLECKVSRNAQYIRVRQVDESLDAQFRQTNFVANWVTKQVGRGAFFVANRLPTKSPVNQILQDIPGVEREGPRLWRINLQETDLGDLLQNRSWMVEKLSNLTEFASLPGLSTLIDSQDLLMQLVNQFEIRDVRVRPGRLELLVGIATIAKAG